MFSKEGHLPWDPKEKEEGETRGGLDPKELEGDWNTMRLKKRQRSSHAQIYTSKRGDGPYSNYNGEYNKCRFFWVKIWCDFCFKNAIFLICLSKSLERKKGNKKRSRETTQKIVAGIQEREDVEVTKHSDCGKWTKYLGRILEVIWKEVPNPLDVGGMVSAEITW